MSIPRNNSENHWHIEKYQSILSMLDDEAAEIDSADWIARPVGAGSGRPAGREAVGLSLQQNEGPL
jgi:hypothetical protein